MHSVIEPSLQPCVQFFSGHWCVCLFFRMMENLLVPVSLTRELKVSNNQKSPKSLWVTDFPVHCLRINKHKKGEQEVSRREKVVLFRKSGKAPEGELSQERGFCLVSCPPGLVSLMMGIWWRPWAHDWNWAIFGHHLTDWISERASTSCAFLLSPTREMIVYCLFSQGAWSYVMVMPVHSPSTHFTCDIGCWWRHLSFLFPGYITHLWFTGDLCPFLLPACGEPSPVSTCSSHTRDETVYGLPFFLKNIYLLCTQ